MSYYNALGKYYDAEAHEYEQRYWKNPIQQRMRQSFRAELMRYQFTDVLEVGFGNGIDLAHLHEVRDGLQLYGMETSGQMCNSAREKLGERADLKHGHAGQLPELFPGQQFDVIYVFFGALNTCEDLDEVAAKFHGALKPDGRLVLTFVNKWYLFGMLTNLVRFRFSQAFSRLGKHWYGYSPDKRVKGKCWSPAEIKESFRSFKVERQRGYCIVHPAWYMRRLATKIRPALKYLWKTDRLLNHTPAWEWGEYTLFVFKKM